MMLLQRCQVSALLGYMLTAMHAQARAQVIVSGTIKSDSGRPLANASVLIDGMGVGTITKDNGRYIFIVPAERVRGQLVTLSARLLQYAPESAKVKLEGDSVRRDFVLGSRPLKLVTVLFVRPDSTNSEEKEIEAGYGYLYPGALKSARLTDLQRTRHSRGEREIRVWSGLSIGIPKQLYRFVNRDGVVEGEVFYHWDWTFDVESGVWADDRRRLRATAGEWCDHIKFEGDVWTCRAKFETEPNWSEIWSEMEAGGVFQPHDYSLTKSPFYVETDGMEFTVELWDGHAYHRWTPRPGNSQEELDRGNALMQFVWQLGRSAARMR